MIGQEDATPAFGDKKWAIQGVQQTGHQGQGNRSTCLLLRNSARPQTYLPRHSTFVRHILGVLCTYGSRLLCGRTKYWEGGLRGVNGKCVLFSHFEKRSGTNGRWALSEREFPLPTAQPS